MTTEKEIATFGAFQLDPSARLLLRGGEVISVGGRAMDILIALVERTGEVVSRRELMQRAWPDAVVEEANLRVHIGSLRKALGEGEAGARYVANVAGRGYCFVMPVHRTLLVQGGMSDGPTRPSLRPTHLPNSLTRMVGRDEAVSALANLLKSRRCVSLVGVGGVGKTTVAVCVAHQKMQEFDRAVYFVDLGVIEDSSLVMEAVSAAVGLVTRGQDPMLDLCSCLAGRQVLLILDNCEHLIDTVALLVERLHAGLPGLHILATSRESLRIEGEHVYLLPPLDMPPLSADLTATRALESSAVQLFMDRAEAGGFRFGLVDKDAPTVAALCNRLDGIPLALELAGGCVGTYGVQGTAELLGNRFKLLWRGRRSAPPRHQTLHAMVDWSYNLLSDQERRVLASLSIFVGPFTLEAAQAVVCDDNFPAAVVACAIASLADKSLVSILITRGDVVFRLLETTRIHAAVKLAESGELTLVARRYALYCSRQGVAGRNAGTLQGPADGRDHVSGSRTPDDVGPRFEWGAPKMNGALPVLPSRRREVRQAVESRFECRPV